MLSPTLGDEYSITEVLNVKQCRSHVITNTNKQEVQSILHSNYTHSVLTFSQ